MSHPDAHPEHHSHHESTAGNLIDDTRNLDSLLDHIRWASSRMEEHGVFLGHGTSRYWDEAAWLVLDSLNLALDLDASLWGAKLTPSESRQVIELIRRRCLEHIPTAYLLNRAWFLGQPYYVDERVLIPRSPFGHLIETRFAAWGFDEQPPQRALDIGTGSGCLAIALATAYPDAEVVGSDISFDALSVAAINVDHYQLHDRVELMQSDIFDHLLDDRDQPLTFDLIISNPPYVDPDEAEDLPDEYHREPANALFAEEHGLALVERMLDQAAAHLTPNGRLFVEVGNGRRMFEHVWPGSLVEWVDIRHSDAAIFTLSREQLEGWRGE